MLAGLMLVRELAQCTTKVDRTSLIQNDPEDALKLVSELNIIINALRFLRGIFPIASMWLCLPLPALFCNMLRSANLTLMFIAFLDTQAQRLSGMLINISLPDFAWLRWLPYFISLWHNCICTCIGWNKDSIIISPFIRLMWLLFCFLVLRMHNVRIKNARTCMK